MHIYIYILLALIIFALIVALNRALKQRNRLAILATLASIPDSQGHVTDRELIIMLGEHGLNISYEDFYLQCSNLAKRGYIQYEDDTDADGQVRRFKITNKENLLRAF